MLRLKDLLKEKGKTGKEFAAELGISQTAMTNIVQGNSFPKPDLLKEIARILDVDIRELFIPTKNENQDSDFKCPKCGTHLTISERK